MAHFHIEGLQPYDGDHEVPTLDSLNNRDFHTIKKISGVRAAEIEEGFAAGDVDLLVAFVVISLQRKSFRVDIDRIWDAPPGAIDFVGDKTDEVAESPPAVTPAELGANENGKEKHDSSGDSSKIVGEQPENDPSPIGPLPSDIGAPSARVTSVI